MLEYPRKSLENVAVAAHFLVAIWIAIAPWLPQAPWPPRPRAHLAGPKERLNER
jgi:hypothetical protein